MIVIMADSSAYLTRQEAKDLSVVHIPMTYTVGGQSHAETFILENESFQAAVNAKPGEVQTSQPTMGAFQRRFKRLIEAGCEVICLTISSRLSGTYSNAKVCAEPYGDKISVIDTRTSASGVYLMILEARNLIDEGATLGEVTQAMKDMRSEVHSYFSVTDLTPLRKSGRLGFVRQSIGTILNQRPILSIKDGAVVCEEVARGSNDQMRRLTERVPENAAEVFVEYFKEKKMAEQLAKRLEERLQRPVQVRRVGLVLGVHLGYDVVGVAWKE